MNNYKPPRPAKQLPDGTFEIPLTRGYVTVVDAEDADLAAFKWLAMPARAQFRAFRQEAKKTLYIHRVILSRVLGRDLLSDEFVDHINGNSLDNRRCNLRLATRAENIQNQVRHKDTVSGYKGVTWNKNISKWYAVITVNGKRIHLGVFDTPESAHAAYCTAGRELHGEFFNPGNSKSKES